MPPWSYRKTTETKCVFPISFLALNKGASPGWREEHVIGKHAAGVSNLSRGCRDYATEPTGLCGDASVCDTLAVERSGAWWPFWGRFY